MPRERVMDFYFVGIKLAEWNGVEVRFGRLLIRRRRKA
jgi:hypothetical protein